MKSPGNIPPENLNYTDYLLFFKPVYRDIDVLEIPGNDKCCIQSRVRDCALASYRHVDKMSDRNLSKEEQTSLGDLIKMKDSVIKGKWNNNVILNRKGYISKMKTILKDTSKFRKLSKEKNKSLNHFCIWTIRL